MRDKKESKKGFRNFFQSNQVNNEELNNELEEQMAREEEAEVTRGEASEAGSEPFGENDDVTENQESQEVQDKQKQDADNEESKIEKLQNELSKTKDDYLRLMAEFDNFRRRVAKEKIDLITTASEGVLKNLLPIIDDFERALQNIEQSEDSEAVKQGTNLIYKKLKDFLKSNGVEEIEAVGLDLDTDLHEAIAQLPASDSKQKGKIIEVTQKGYKLGEKVIRFAKVVVGV